LLVDSLLLTFYYMSEKVKAYVIFSISLGCQDVAMKFAKNTGCPKMVFLILVFIIQSYFKLHLQNTYQLKDQLKKFYEQQFVINKVQ
jgi:hypothetical protein